MGDEIVGFVLAIIMAAILLFGGMYIGYCVGEKEGVIEGMAGAKIVDGLVITTSYQRERTYSFELTKDKNDFLEKMAKNKKENK